MGSCRIDVLVITVMDPPAYRLGCPAWADGAWFGSLYSTKDRRRWLAEYSTVFGTVEGNSTFYAMPALDVVRRWAEEARPGFRFALKTPAAITHERQLVDVASLAAEWIERLRVLQSADLLGPTLLQLPPFFTGGQFSDLVRFVEDWPEDLPLAIEPRHDDYFDAAACENEFDAMLRERGVDRALFDSRALFHAPPDDDFERASQGRKPNPPRRLTVTGRRPFVRFVGRNDRRLVSKWIAEWAGTIADWIDQGLNPYVFCHSPNDAYAPEFCEELHEAVRERRRDVPPLAEWPGRAAPKQRELF